MTKLSKIAIQTLIPIRYDDNTSGDIAASDDRDQHTDLTDSFINELDQVGSGSNSGSGGKNFPEVLDISDFDVPWNLDNRLDGMAYLADAVNHSITMYNFRPGTKRELIFKKTTALQVQLNFISAEAIDMFNLQNNEADYAFFAHGAINTIFKITFFNFNDYIYWIVSDGPDEEDLDTSNPSILIYFRNNKNFPLLKGTTDIAGAKSWQFIGYPGISDPPKFLKTTILINITALPAVQTFPDTVLRSSVFGDWDSSTYEWTPAMIGIYKLDFTKYGTSYLLSIEGPF